MSTRKQDIGMEVLKEFLSKFSPLNPEIKKIVKKSTMPPRKRGRPKKDNVPIKKRKLCISSGSDSEEDENEEKQKIHELLPIPEWFKVSIQMMLINFFPQGVALLQSMQDEYETIFKGSKPQIDTSNYGFVDWENMLKSPQFKKHCLVYTEKRIQYCRGYPLARSTGIMMKGDRTWEIDPKFMKDEKCITKTVTTTTTTDSPQSPIQSISPRPVIPEGSASVLPSTSINSVDKSQGNSENVLKNETPPDKPRRSSSTSLNSADKSQPQNSASILTNGSLDNKSEPNSTVIQYSDSGRIKNRQHNNPTPAKRMPQLPIILPDSEIVRTANSRKASIASIDEEPEPILATHSKLETPLKTFTELPSPSSSTPKENENIAAKDSEDSQKPEARVVQEEFSQHSLNADFFRRSDVPSNWTNIQDDEVMIISESFSTKPRPSLVPVQQQKDYNTQPKESNKASTPPPPRLLPQVKFDRHMSERIKERRRMGDPRKIYISNSKMYDLETTDLSSNEENSQKSDSTYCSAENSEVTSVNSDNSEQNGPSDRVTVLSPWHFTPVLIPNIDPKHIFNLTMSLKNNEIQSPSRDPRLTVGLRKKHFSFIIEDMKDISNPTEEGSNNKPTKNLENGALNNERIEQEEEKKESTKEGKQIPIFKQNSTMEPERAENSNRVEITIINTNAVEKKAKEDEQRKLEMCVPLQKVVQFKNYLHNEESIPISSNNTLSLNFNDLWKNVRWKLRYNQDSISHRMFFNSEVYERWEELTRAEFSNSTYKMQLVHECQKYEDKKFPSRCEFYLRSSLRMVELDYRTSRQFSEPRDANGDKLVGQGELLFYVDFAGNPGGVFEFYHKIRRISSKGFGVTYQKRKYDFNGIPDMHPEFFEAFYGKLNSYNGDGSLFCPETVDTFTNRVLDATNGKGVHIVSTIGNISRIVFDDENDEKWKFQHLAHVMVALMVLREGGNLALKMYDLKKSFTVGLVFLLYRTFREVRISKLNIFAPTSGERVIICLGRKNTVEYYEILKFLKECFKSLADWYMKEKVEKSKTAIEEILPISILESQVEFMDYIRESNERIKWTQIEELTLCMKNIKKTRSMFTKGMYRALVARTTELWKVALLPQTKIDGNFSKNWRSNSKNPVATFRELRIAPERNVCDAVEAILNEFNLYTIFSSTEHWRFSPIGNLNKTRGFYLGVNGVPHFFNSKNKEWNPVAREYDFKLPSKTLVYGEIIKMNFDDFLNGEDIFTILDGYSLAGININHMTYAQRISECEKFAAGVTKAFFPKMTKLTVTKAFNFTELPTFLEKIVISGQEKFVDRSSNRLRLPVNSVYKLGVKNAEKNYWFHTSGLLFFEAGSKTTDFCTSMLSRVFWEWVTGMDIPFSTKTDLSGDMDISEVSRPIGTVSARKLVDFVNRYST